MREGFTPTLIVFPSTTPTLDADVAAMAALKQRFGAPMFCFGPHASTTPAESMAARAGSRRHVRRRAGRRAVCSSPRSTRSIALGDDPEPDVAAQRRQSCAAPRARQFTGFPTDAVSRRGICSRSSTTRCRWSTSRTCIVETSRGCPYTCDFCVAPIHQGHKFRERSAKALVDEIERSTASSGVEFFYLWGDTVTLNVKSFTAFCDELIARKLPIQWFGNARADNLTDPAFVHRLKRAGCWMLALGIETESEEVRKDMVKRLERQKIQTAFKNMRDAGIKSFAFFIFGYPGETPQTMEQTIEYAIELDPDFANFYPAVPYPGTALYDKCVREGWLTPEDADWTKMEYSYYLLRGNGLDEQRRDGRDQPREAPLLPAARLHRAARRRCRALALTKQSDRLAGRCRARCSARGSSTRSAVRRRRVDGRRRRPDSA